MHATVIAHSQLTVLHDTPLRLIEVTRADLDTLTAVAMVLTAAPSHRACPRRRG
jgi:predicted AAA+ superfamily ATPase